MGLNLARICGDASHRLFTELDDVTQRTYACTSHDTDSTHKAQEALLFQHRADTAKHAIRPDTVAKAMKT